MSENRLAVRCPACSGRVVYDYSAMVSIERPGRVEWAFRLFAPCDRCGAEVVIGMQSDNFRDVKDE